MNANDAARLARQLMNDHGLSDWRFKFDRAKSRFGRCDYSHQEISLSKPLVVLNDEADVRNTILHEIAHALVGTGHHHDRVWKLKCLEVGARPETCARSHVKVPEKKWVGRCPECGVEARRDRLTAKAQRVACASCCRIHNNGRYSDRFLFQWEAS